MKVNLALEPTLKFLLAAASLVVVVGGLRSAEAVFVPFLVAAFLAVLTLPVLGSLRRRGVPRGLAVLAAMLVNVTVLGALGWLLGLSLSRVSEQAPAYQARVQQLADVALAWLDAHRIHAADWFSPESIKVGALLEVVSGTFKRVAGIVTWVFLVLLMMTFILFEAPGFDAKVRAALGDRQERLRRFAKVTGEIQRYLVIKTLVSLATGVSVGLWVAVVGLDFPLLWGFIGFLFNYIPNIGSIVAAIPAVVLALLQLGVARSALVALGYVLINLLWGNLVEPQLMGRRLRLSPLVVFLSLVFWGWVWGPLGMLLSVPLTVVLKILLENTEDLRWVAELMDQGPRQG